MKKSCFRLLNGMPFIAVKEETNVFCNEPSSLKF